MTEPLPDPLEGIPLPYAVDLVPDGGTIYAIPAGQRGGTAISGRHALEPGTYDVEFSIDAPARAILRLYKAGGGFFDIAEVPDVDSAAPRSSDLVTINVPEGATTAFLTVRSSTPYPAADSGYSGAILISPIKKAGA